jgi:hypothetical protein
MKSVGVDFREDKKAGQRLQEACINCFEIVSDTAWIIVN